MKMIFSLLSACFVSAAVLAGPASSSAQDGRHSVFLLNDDQCYETLCSRRFIGTIGDRCNWDENCRTYPCGKCRTHTSIDGTMGNCVAENTEVICD